MRGSKGIEGPIGQAGLYGNPGDIGAVGKDGRKGKYSFFPIYHKRFKLLIQYFLVSERFLLLNLSIFYIMFKMFKISRL